MTNIIKFPDATERLIREFYKTMEQDISPQLNNASRITLTPEERRKRAQCKAYTFGYRYSKDSKD
jgi:hypothetical protein